MPPSSQHNWGQSMKASMVVSIHWQPFRPSAVPIPMLNMYTIFSIMISWIQVFNLYSVHLVHVPFILFRCVNQWGIHSGTAWLEWNIYYSFGSSCQSWQKWPLTFISTLTWCALYHCGQCGMRANSNLSTLFFTRSVLAVEWIRHANTHPTERRTKTEHYIEYCGVITAVCTD